MRRLVAAQVRLERDVMTKTKQPRDSSARAAREEVASVEDGNQARRPMSPER